MGYYVLKNLQDAHNLQCRQAMREEFPGTISNRVDVWSVDESITERQKQTENSFACVSKVNDIKWSRCGEETLQSLAVLSLIAETAEEYDSWWEERSARNWNSWLKSALAVFTSASRDGKDKSNIPFSLRNFILFRYRREGHPFGL